MSRVPEQRGLPRTEGFAVTRRGYDPLEVEVRLRDQDIRLVMLAADRDALMTHARQLRDQLERQRAEVSTLRERVRRISEAAPTAVGVSERLHSMLRLGHEEAAQERRRARHDAAVVRSTAQVELARVRRLRARLGSEVTERGQRRDREGADRAAADAAATARRAQADEDFRIALAARRAEAAEDLRRECEQARGEASHVLDSAREEAGVMIEAARDRLASADRVLAQLRTRSAALSGDERPGPDSAAMARRDPPDDVPSG